MNAPEPVPESIDNDERPKQRDAKDFIEHLRTVHFTLVAVCTALLVIVLSPPPRRYQDAYDELRDINDAVGKWQNDWLDKEAVELLHQNRCRESDEPLLVKLGGGRILTLSLLPPLWTVYSRNFDNPDIFEDLMKRTLLKPKTLLEFKHVWDSDFSLVCAGGPQAALWVHDASEEKWRFLADPSANGSYTSGTEAGAGVSLLLMHMSRIQPAGLGHPPPLFKEPPFTESKEEHFVYFGQGFADKGGYRDYLIPVNNDQRYRVPFRDVLAKTLSRGNWRDVEFSDQFTEIDDLTKGFQDLEFEHLRPILQSLATSSKEAFEVFGIRFPIESTTRWGLAIILAVQLYFLVHLSELNKRQLASADIAWVGTYSGFVPRTIFVTTAAVLPIGVMVLLGFRVGFGVGHRADIAIAISAVILSGLLALLCLRQNPQSPVVPPLPPKH